MNFYFFFTVPIMKFCYNVLYYFFSNFLSPRFYFIKYPFWWTWWWRFFLLYFFLWGSIFIHTLWFIPLVNFYTHCMIYFYLFSL